MAETLVITKQLAVQAGLRFQGHPSSFRLTLSAIAKNPRFFDQKLLTIRNFASILAVLKRFNTASIFTFILSVRVFLQRSHPFGSVTRWLSNRSNFCSQHFLKGGQYLTNRRGHERTMRMFGGSRLSCSHTAA